MRADFFDSAHQSTHEGLRRYNARAKLAESSSTRRCSLFFPQRRATRDTYSKLSRDIQLTCSPMTKGQPRCLIVARHNRARRLVYNVTRQSIYRHRPREVIASSVYEQGASFLALKSMFHSPAVPTHRVQVTDRQDYRPTNQLDYPPLLCLHFTRYRPMLLPDTSFRLRRFQCK